MSKENKKTIDYALEYLDIGWSIIPICRPIDLGNCVHHGKCKSSGKVPLVEWAKYQLGRASKEQLRQWLEKDFPNANIAVVTGKISGIVAVDVEAGGSIENLSATVNSKSGGGGLHFFYLWPEGGVKNAVRIRELTDIRGDGGIIVLPPSIHKSGNRYSWVVSPDDAAFAELPQWIREKTMEFKKTDWQKFLSEEKPDGIRNMSATQLAGKLLHELPQEFWEISGWATLKEWNIIQNKPQLEEKELRKVWESIKSIEIKKENQDEVDAPKTNQSSLLLEQIENNKDIILFHDELNEPHIGLVLNGHKEIWRVRSKQFKRWLAKAFWEKQKKTANSDALNTALTIVEAKACFDGKEFKLANRTTWLEENIWYDLSDKNWSVIKITSNGWDIVKMPPILFRRFSHQQAQVLPIAGGDAKSVLNFVNIQNEKQKLLFLVYLISSFIPDFPHPILNIYGSQGSAKSTLSKIVRLLVDPSIIEVSEIPKTEVELIQKLSHHWLIFFDNVSFLSYEVSDLLCRAVTGTGFSKRELYSDDEDIIYTLKRCIGINGINLVAEKPDLLERSILLELDRVPKENRRQEKELFEEFERERPKILGGILDTLVRALQIKETLQLEYLPRMADFTVWGCAISTALGFTKEDFLVAYGENITNQNNEVLYESFVASALMEFMRDRNDWKGTPSELLSELAQVASSIQGVDTVKEKSFPKAANVLSRRLNQLKPNLAEEGIQFIRGEENHQRIIFVQKVANNTVSTDEPSQESLTVSDLGTDTKDDSDDSNDSIQVLLDS